MARVVAVVVRVLLGVVVVKLVHREVLDVVLAESILLMGVMVHIVVDMEVAVAEVEHHMLLLAKCHQVAMHLVDSKSHRRSIDTNSHHHQGTKSRRKLQLAMKCPMMLSHQYIHSSRSHPSSSHHTLHIAN